MVMEGRKEATSKKYCAILVYIHAHSRVEFRGESSQRALRTA